MEEKEGFYTYYPPEKQGWKSRIDAHKGQRAKAIAKRRAKNKRKQ